MSVQRYDTDWENGNSIAAKDYGKYVLFTDHEAAVSEARAEAITRLEGWVPLGNRERVAQAREQAIRDCIDAVEALGHVVDCVWSHEEDQPCPHEETIAALRALLPEGSE